MFLTRHSESFDHYYLDSKTKRMGTTWKLEINLEIEILVNVKIWVPLMSQKEIFQTPHPGKFPLSVSGHLPRGDSMA